MMVHVSFKLLSSSINVPTTLRLGALIVEENKIHYLKFNYNFNSCIY